MKYLLDTCVISEIVRPKPDKRVIEWIDAQPEQNLYLSVLTLGEIARGIHRLPGGRKKRQLQSWLESDLKDRFSGKWLPIDETVAERWALLSVEASRSGVTLPTTDGLLVATALVHGMNYVTRDESFLARVAVSIVNPWKLG